MTQATLAFKLTAYRGTPNNMVIGMGIGVNGLQTRKKAGHT